MADLLPPPGWDGVPSGLLPVLLDLPEDHAPEYRTRHDLLWPARTPLPRVGDTLTRRGYRSNGDGTYQDVVRQHLVLRYEWETMPGHGSVSHPMLSALVLVLSEGDER